MFLGRGRVSKAKAGPARAEQRLGPRGRRRGSFVRFGEELAGAGEIT